MRRIRTRRPSRHLLLLLALALAAGGCGGDDGQTARTTTAAPEPKLAQPVADALAQRSEAIADALDAGDVCTAAVRADELNAAVVAAINEGNVPAQLQEPLMARANELVNSVNCPAPADEGENEEEDDTSTEEPADDEEDGNGKAKGKDKNKGKGKGDDPTETVITVPAPPEVPQP